MPRFDKLLILDLDETLIHTSETDLADDPHFRVSGFPVYMRPGLVPFLTRCMGWFETAIWTASDVEYAQAILSEILPDPGGLAFVWDRSRCRPAGAKGAGSSGWIKDLTKLSMKGYLPTKVVMIDDIPENCHGGHVIPITPFRGDPTDSALTSMLNFLETVGSTQNLRGLDLSAWHLPRRRRA